MYYVSFPGLGIEPFHMDKTAFTVFGRDIVWYGVLITCGMILAVLCGLWLAKKENISSDNLFDLAFTVIIFGVLGARLYYVIFEWDHYLVTTAMSDGTVLGAVRAFLSNAWATFKNAIAIWEGGLAIYGGILAGLLSGFVFAKIKKIPFLKIADILAPCVTVGQILGRWGNFVNVEAHGGDTTLPWRMGIHFSLDGGNTFLAEQFVHPTFLYESLWNTVGLVLLLLIFVRGKRFDGQSFCTYLIWYGFGRMLIEGLRTDSLMWGPVRVSQMVGLLSLIIGLILLIFLAKKSHTRTAAVTSEARTDEIVETMENNKTLEK